MRGKIMLTIGLASILLDNNYHAKFSAIVGYELLAVPNLPYFSTQYVFAISAEA
jgi:hypothetical protein